MYKYLYLIGGRTVHFKLKVPIKLGPNTLCNFQEKSATAELVRRASLFIIDEYTLGDKRVYETIDRTFKELLQNDEPYGDKIFLHSGDWVSNIHKLCAKLCTVIPCLT